MLLGAGVRQEAACPSAASPRRRQGLTPRPLRGRPPGLTPASFSGSALTGSRDLPGLESSPASDGLSGLSLLVASCAAVPVTPRP